MPDQQQNSQEESAQSPAKGDSKWHPLTWERTVEIVKLLATVWVALIGTVVTMQFNERQHELNRIEAIAKMLPHVSAKETVAAKANGKGIETQDMSRDGAIWAIFRTANNKTMLKDLASLFPEDIYRVVNSIAVAGGLEKDSDAITALQVASEKLAAKYSNDPAHRELASRLYNQAVRLKERPADDARPLNIVDITTAEVASPVSEDQSAALIHSVVRLGDLHFAESETSKKVNAGHWQAKQLYKHARQLGLNSSDKQVQKEVARADLQLGSIYALDGRYKDALTFLAEARELQSKAYGANAAEVKETDRRMEEMRAKVQ